MPFCRARVAKVCRKTCGVWEYRISAGDYAGAAEILNVSPIAWLHLNFRGRYKFKNREKLIDLDAIVRKLARAQIESGTNQVA